jgi:hypothetical protein
MANFPQLSSVALWDNRPTTTDFSEGSTGSDSLHLTKLQGSLLAPRNRLEWLETLNMEVSSGTDLRKLNRVLPQLGKLLLLRVRFANHLLSESLDPDVNPNEDIHFSNLVAAIRQNLSVRNVRVFNRDRQNQNYTDDAGEWMLVTLPLRISNLIFKGKVLRLDPDEDNALKDLKFLLH